MFLKQNITCKICYQKNTVSLHCEIKEKLVKKFREENKGKWIWYNGAMGIDNALSNNNIEKTREKAVEEMAWHDNVTIEEVENDYDNWYYILPVEEILDEYLIDFFENEA